MGERLASVWVGRVTAAVDRLIAMDSKSAVDESEGSALKFWLNACNSLYACNRTDGSHRFSPYVGICEENPFICREGATTHTPSS